MNFQNVKMELVAPLFAGILNSLIVCTLIAAPVLHLPGPDPLEIAGESNTEEIEPEDLSRIFSAATEETSDLILEQYKNPEYSEWVVEFFTKICKSREIAEAILAGAQEFNVSPALAFALSWEESRFNPGAVSKKNGDESIDRGLFQLNNHSFPALEISVFFNVRDNARYGIAHLRHCMDSGGSEIAALAMYNAGTGRVKNAGTPKVTLDYIHRILENRKRVESDFQNRLIKEEEARLIEKSVSGDKPIASVKSYLGRTIISASPL